MSTKAQNKKTTSSAKEVSAPVETVQRDARTLIASARKEFGTVESVEDTINGLDSLRAAAQTAYRGWSLVALAAKAEGVTGVEFATLAGVKGANKMAMTRYVRAGRMFAAIGKKKVDPFEVRALVNGIGNGGVTAAEFDKVVSEVAGGKAFGKTVEAAKPKKVEKGAARPGTVTGGKEAGPRTKTAVTAKPSEFGTVLGIILANLHKCADSTLVDVERLAQEIADAAMAEREGRESKTA